MENNGSDSLQKVKAEKHGLNAGSAIISEFVLLQCIPQSDKRYPTFCFVLHQLLKRNLKTIVETGTARNGAGNCIGDGCSTVIWRNWAKEFDGYVYSIDIDPHALSQSRKACNCDLLNIEFICSDSVSFLQNFGNRIDLLYLDSYDYDIQNPDPSQWHHLKEIMAAYPYLHEESVILIDDCDLPGGGKGKLVIEFLLERGWKIAMSGYQAVMVYKE
ncbi:MAG: class I SAM-dependent methyltransferase [Parachlamydiales bacterium]|nr:class I SAM-dependent methyltransferase [Candidatus Acheromyda pituitae]